MLSERVRTGFNAEGFRAYLFIVGHAWDNTKILCCRSALMQEAGQKSGSARETDRTAELDNVGILNMQQEVMQEQDQSLAQMEQSVASTRVRWLILACSNW